MAAEPRTLASLVDAYDAFFFDAYGVLCDHQGPLPGAHEAIAGLRAAGKTTLVVTNDASKPPAAIADRFSRWGFSFTERDIVSSGGLLHSFCAAHGLDGEPALVLGPKAALDLATSAGLHPVGPDAAPARVFILDEMGYDFVPTVEAATHHIVERVGRPGPQLIVVNPDVIYPQGNGRFGLAAGGIARLIMDMAAARGVDITPATTFLGKPHAPIFDAAVTRANTRNALMLGDQVATDILGARAFGLDAALVCTGISARADEANYVLASLTD